VNFLSDTIAVAPGASRTVAVDVVATDARAPSTSSAASVIVSGPPPPAPPLAPRPTPPAPKVEQPPIPKAPQTLLDMVFAYGKDRVTSCGRRILNQAAAALAADPDLEIALIGHIDPAEGQSVWAKKLAPLDERRAFSAASVLTAPEQPCHRIDPPRVSVGFVGGDQSRPYRDLLCPGSMDEVPEDHIPPSPRSCNWRVEVWLLPRGTRPPEVTLQEFSAGRLAKACQK
jgi:hypothetical protein